MPSATKQATDTTPKTRGPSVTKVGNLCADPELRFATTGKAYARMRIAVTSPVVPGEWAGARDTAYYDVTAFGTLAEHAAESLSKGDRVVVTGTAEVREYTAKDGSAQKAKGILAEALGPDLRFTTATVAKPQRSEAGPPSSRDDEEPF